MQNGKRFSWMRIFAFLVCIGLIGLSFLFAGSLERIINFNTAGGSNVSSGEEEAIAGSLFKVHFLDDNQADCNIIELPGGEIMMIDCGLKLRTYNATKIINYLNDVIFDGRHSKRIDYFIITHTDFDHIAAAPAILAEFEIGTVYRPMVYYYKQGDSDSESRPVGAAFSDTAAWKNTVKAINNNAENIIFNEAGLNLSGGRDVNGNNQIDANESWEMKFYSPISQNYGDTNDFSPMIVLQSNNVKFMFTGDAASKIEKEWLEHYNKNPAVFDIDVLSVGHHGSRYSSCDDFLKATTPKYAIISCGEGNSYGHPHNEAINRLLAHMDVIDINGNGTQDEALSRLLRTDLMGTILMYLESDGTIQVLGNYYRPNEYYIEWYYVAISLSVISLIICFAPKYANKTLQKTSVSNNTGTSYSSKSVTISSKKSAVNNSKSPAKTGSSKNKSSQKSQSKATGGKKSFIPYKNYKKK